MYFDLEESFVNNYINPLYRDRLLFEFKSSKKRLTAIMRFSHNIDSLVKENKVFSKLKEIDDKKLKLFLKGKELYVVSFKYLDGILMGVNEAVNYVCNEYMPVIIFGANVAVIKKEFEKGGDNIYLLKNSNNQNV